MIFPAIAAGGAVVDGIQRAKVDNAWLLFCLVISLTVQLMERGTGGFIAWSFGACTPFLVLGWLFLFRMLGAGDIKLFCVMGSVLGPGTILRCIAYSFLIGAVISAALMDLLAASFARESNIYSAMSAIFSKQEKENPMVKAACRWRIFTLQFPYF